jgi:hypothetical protein
MEMCIVFYDIRSNVLLYYMDGKIHRSSDVFLRPPILSYMANDSFYNIHAGDGVNWSPEPSYRDGLAERGGGRAEEGDREGGQPPAEEGES